MPYFRFNLFIKPISAISLVLMVAVSCSGNCCAVGKNTKSGQESDVLLSDFEIERRLNDAKLPNSTGNDAFYIFLHIGSGGDTSRIKPADGLYWLELSAKQGHSEAKKFWIVHNLNLRTEKSCSLAIRELNYIKNSGKNISVKISPVSIETCNNILRKSEIIDIQ